MATTRTATAHWEGSLMEGAGEVTLQSSGHAFNAAVVATVLVFLLWPLLRERGTARGCCPRGARPASRCPGGTDRA